MIRDVCCGSRLAAHLYLGIILEERSKMNKKILDVAVAFFFAMSLIVTTNIEEESTANVCETTYVTEQHIAAAGVSLVLSEYSFTTESDEETIIAKNEICRVMSQEISAEAETTQEETVGTEENKEEIIDYSNRWNISLTEEEIDLLAKIVWLEARGEPVEGEMAVVEVVLNRMASDQYPDTLYEVLSQGNPTQFCSWKNRASAQPTEREYQSIYEVLNGNTDILRNDTLYFSREALTPNVDVVIGEHSFCY